MNKSASVQHFRKSSFPVNDVKVKIGPLGHIKGSRRQVRGQAELHHYGKYVDVMLCTVYIFINESIVSHHQK